MADMLRLTVRKWHKRRVKGTAEFEAVPCASMVHRNGPWAGVQLRLWNEERGTMSLTMDADAARAVAAMLVGAAARADAHKSIFVKV